jgi:hypothetical protein
MAGGVESVIITITLSLAGLVWSVISYTLFTKWLCCRSIALKDRLLNYFTEKCSQQRGSGDELQIMPREEAGDFEISYMEATSTMDEEHHNGISGQHHMMDESTGLGEGDLMNESQLLEGEECVMEGQGEGGQSGEIDDQAESNDSEGSPLIGGHKLILFFTVLQIIAKPIVLAVNIVYLVESINESNQLPIFFFDILGNENTDPEFLQLVAQAFAEGITNFCILYESFFLVIGPIYAIILWTCCWRRHDRLRLSCCRKYLEYLRFNDLELAVLLAPFANINFFFLGNKWYSVLIVRLIFYAITFASAVIAGMRFVCAVSCFYCCACACNTEAIEVRTYKHLFAGMGFQLLSIFLKLLTTSSAFSTYLLLGIQLNYSLRLAYLVFTVLRGVSSLFSLGFTAALLRWTVLTKESQEHKSCLNRLLGWVDKYQPHTHIAFIVDMVCYIGLLVLNVMLLTLPQ